MTDYLTPVKAARRRKGWTLAELAAEIERAGCPVTTSALSRIENRERSPRPALAAALAKVLGLDAATL
jgi:transcriptional regulator with XRE-family HTH domain